MRHFKWSVLDLVLITACLAVSWIAINKSTAMGCFTDGNQWTFTNCNLSYLVLFLYDAQTMLCAIIVRYVFVKTEMWDDNCLETLGKAKSDIIKAKDGHDFSD